MLIILAGLPGTGKSSLAIELARRIGATYLRIDSIEQAILNSSCGFDPAEDAGYMVGYALAEDNLRLGRTVIVDAVNPVPLARTSWLDIANRVGCDRVCVELVCSDPVQHRRRIETRTTDISGLKLPTWQDVLDREYHSWSQDHIVIDTANRSIDQCVHELLSILPASVTGKAAVQHSTHARLGSFKED